MPASFRRVPLIAAVAAAFGLATTAPPAHAASLIELFERVPAPPADVGTALGWLQNGQIVNPEYTQLKQALEAERSAIATLNGGTLPASSDSAPKLPATETPEVQGAVRAYADYLASNSGKQAPAPVLGKRARWLHAAMSGRLGTVLGAMKPCPSPCTDTTALAANQPMLPAREELAEQDLRQWNTLFLDWQAKRRGVIASAQAFITATGEGARATSAEGRAGLAAYRAAMLREVEVALSVTELALRRANAIETVDVDAVSGSTYSPKKKS
ncbi:MAG: hypothetical protein ACREUE_07500 [Panacagrimonas sp.]